jgi:hypothetical protein
MNLIHLKNKVKTMKNPINLLMTFTVAVLVTFTACKKTAEPQTPSETATHSDDQSQFTAEVDAVTEDANDIINESASFNFRTASSAVCDAVVSVDTSGLVKKITVEYTGGLCIGKNRKRSGIVELSMPKGKRWNEAGAQLTITYKDLTVTRLSDNKSIVLNGSAVVTNVTGGNIIHLANSSTPMVHTLTSDGIVVKFPSGATRTWMMAKRREFSYDNGIVITISGTHTDGTMTHISEWGVNRAGEDFKTVISQPLVIRQSCSFRVTGGKIEYNTNIKLAITFGLDAAGNPTGCPGTGLYYFKAEYTDLRSVTHTLIWPY